MRCGWRETTLYLLHTILIFKPVKLSDWPKNNLSPFKKSGPNGNKGRSCTFSHSTLKYFFVAKSFFACCCSKVNSILKEKSWQRGEAINQQTIHCHVWYFLLQKFPKQDFSNLELSICMVILTFKRNLRKNWQIICYLHMINEEIKW